MRACGLRWPRLAGHVCIVSSCVSEKAKGKAMHRRILTSPWLRRLGIPTLILTVLALAVPALLVRGAPPTPAKTLVPIGGGYSEASLEGFARVVSQHATGTTVNILVVPAAYGDTQKQHQRNVTQATQRAQEIQDA